ncbi:hypothetical protein JCM33374_g5123 [Metschnikowia sp. JCM 33374]|nr:hypothetical protein JCM33374_g5123 [Metschnikowia sp. JCM 33374]
MPPAAATETPETDQSSVINKLAQLNVVEAPSPEREQIPTFLDEAYAIRNHEYPLYRKGQERRPREKALFGAAKEVTNLTAHIGTEIVGLQLGDLDDRQKDELALF